jgi:hypothetical protein
MKAKRYATLSDRDRRFYSTMSKLVREQQATKRLLKERANELVPKKKAVVIEVLRGRTMARREIASLTAWLETCVSNKTPKPMPPEAARFVRWIVRNQGSLFASYNPSMIAIARDAVQAINSDPLLKQYAALISRKLRAIREWRAR